MKRHKILALYLLRFASFSVASDQKMTLDSDIFSPAQQQKALDNLSKPIHSPLKEIPNKEILKEEEKNPCKGLSVSGPCLNKLVQIRFLK